MVAPKILHLSGQNIDFPKPLTPSEAARARRILDLQAATSFVQADKELAHVAEKRLLGPILAARYLNTPYRTTTQQLSDWISKYGDQADAPAIAAKLRAATGHPVPRAGDSGEIGAMEPITQRRTNAVARRGFAKRHFLNNADEASISSGVAELQGKPGSRDASELLGAGFAAWRTDKLVQSGVFFAAAYESAQTPEQRSTAAYWLARTMKQPDRMADRTVWLRRAAHENTTFYGRLARRVLGLAHACEDPKLTKRTLGAIDMDRLIAVPRGWRAFALLQINERARAEAELRALLLDVESDAALSRAISVVADALGMSDLAAEAKGGYAISVAAKDAPKTPVLKPASGFTVDPTIVYGIVRHESNFTADAVSKMGALGLMQILPNTAVGIEALARDQTHKLTDPGINLDVGQRLLTHLARDPAIDGNLMRTLAAFAQGQGAMRRWSQAIVDRGDPLLFMEAIPPWGVRTFVEQTLNESWGYAAALGLPAPSLDMLAADRQPKLESVARTAATPDPAACLKPIDLTNQDW